jgi:anaerobic magnesium-protoporphyrin IX monomethyl ester cyclase
MLKPKTKVALIWPHGLGSFLLPLPYASIVANTDAASCEMRLFDLALGLPAPADLEREIAAFAPDLIGVTAHAMNFPQALEAVRAARRGAPGAQVLAGGPHPSAWPRGVMACPEIDFLIRGEAELAFGAFLAEFRSDSPRWERVPGLTRRGPGGLAEAPPAVVENLDALALPDYGFIRLDEYLRRGYRLFCDGRPSAPIQTTRGCPMACSFCGVSAVSGRRLRHFSAAYTTRLIQSLHRDFGIEWFNIVDDNFTHDIAHARAFCEAALRLDIPGLRFGTPNGVRMQRGDLDLWKLMKRAGWEYLVVAPESGSARVLGLMKKGLSPGEVETILAEVRSAGLLTRGFFMVGYPGETPGDVDQTLDLIRRGRFDSIELLFFQPLPGTQIFDDLVASGEIGPDFLPAAFSSGRLTYVTSGLKGLNFPWIFFKANLGVLLRNPGNILRILRRMDLRPALRNASAHAAALLRGLLRA